MFTVDMRGKMPKSFNFYQLSDLHIGRVGIALPKIHEAIQMIASDKRGYVGFLGDLVETMLTSDPRYTIEEQNGKYIRLSMQWDDVAQIIEPVKGRTIFIAQGNHEERVDGIARISDEISRRVGRKIPGGGRTVKVHFTDTIRYFGTHGSGCVNSMAGDPEQMERNDAIKIKRKLRRLQADCILNGMGHIHKMRICKPTTELGLVTDTKTGKLKQIYTEPFFGPHGELHEDKRYYFSSGAFMPLLLEGVTTYAEKAMYTPNEMGMIKCIIQDGRVIDVVKVIL